MLRKNGNIWSFVSEAALEDYLWSNLEGLLDLIPFKRQQYCNGEVCDILALSRNKQLIVIELKNCEDRYLVQQLTRYHFNLIEEQFFSVDVDYEQPIRLIGIAPSFHRHNLIDRQYSVLPIEFFQLNVESIENQFYLKLEEIDKKNTFRIDLPYREVEEAYNVEGLPELPLVFSDYLGFYSQEERERILRLRAKLLTFDKRMQETVTAKSIKYGRGTSKTCAELYFDSKKRGLILILWLFWPSSHRRLAVTRMRIWTDKWETASYFAYAREGVGKAKLEEEWKSIPQEKWPRRYLRNSTSHKSDIANQFTPYKIFGNLSYLTERAGIKLPDSNSLEDVLRYAASIWQSRL